MLAHYAEGMQLNAITYFETLLFLLGLFFLLHRLWLLWQLIGFHQCLEHVPTAQHANTFVAGLTAAM